MDTAEKFKEMDADGDGILTWEDIESHVRKRLMRGRTSSYATGQAAIETVMGKLMEELDTNKDGLVSWATFSNWYRHNSVEQVVKTIQASSLAAP